MYSTFWINNTDTIIALYTYKNTCSVGTNSQQVGKGLDGHKRQSVGRTDTNIDRRIYTMTRVMPVLRTFTHSKTLDKNSYGFLGGLFPPNIWQSNWLTHTR